MHNQEPISLCIIDDIKSVVDGLTALDWTAHGIAVAGTSSNGEDGLALIRRVKPDLVITDIRMPKLDGLSMVRAILDNQQNCKIILITGYTDFDYAKQAIQLGAYDMVVKPFTEEEIVMAALNAKQEILQERSKLLSYREMEQKLRESMPLLKQEYLSLLVHHRTPWEQAAKRWDFLKIDLVPLNLQVMLLEIDGLQERAELLSVHELELIRFSIQNIVEETLQAHTQSIVFRERENRFVVVLNSLETFHTTEVAETCCKNIERYTKFTVSIGVGDIARAIDALPDSYRQADRALAYHLFTDGNGAISYDELPKSSRQTPLALEQKDELLLALRSGNSSRVADILSELSGAQTKLDERPNPDYLLSLYDELAASAIRTLYELVPTESAEPLVEAFKTKRGTAGITLSLLEQLLLTLCTEGAELVQNNSLSEGQKIIYKSLDYLNSRLDTDVTVADCAGHVHLSGSYYSSLFKKVTGMTFVQYVTAERIHKAKSLLIGGMPVQEVAAAVGYEERRYFSDMFKKITGMTPSEFRASYHPDA